VLHCGFNPRSLSDAALTCGDNCICDPASKLHYAFGADLAASVSFVEELKSHIERETPCRCADTRTGKEPDVLVFGPGDSSELLCRVEAKHLEGKAFVRVAEQLTEPLLPKEVLVVDEPKLLSYFARWDADLQEHGRPIPIYVVWKYDRPCHGLTGITVFQSIEVLRHIHSRKGGSRRFRRRVGAGDVVGGERKGVIDKYHFSIRECRPIEDLAVEIRGLVSTRGLSRVLGYVDQAVQRHPVLRTLGKDTLIGVSGHGSALWGTIRAGGRAAEARIEAPRWWEPVTRAHARELADQLAAELRTRWDGMRRS
jgi:hypothetical protein